MQYTTIDRLVNQLALRELPASLVLHCEAPFWGKIVDDRGIENLKVLKLET